MTIRRGIWFVAALLLAVAGCSKREEPGKATSGGGSRTAPPVAENAVTLVVAYGSEKKTWLEEQARAFEATGAKTRSGRPMKIGGKAMGSGEAAAAILDGSLKPHVFSPASGVYVTLLNDRWLTAGTGRKAIAPTGEPVVLSPIVIAMWRPMAEALGWPDKPIGWSDLIAINANKRGWGAYGHPEWGTFKLGHTHPELSNSGVLAILAEAYAGAKKTRGLVAADLDDKATRDLVTAVEGTIVHYGKSTGFFADKMVERGPAYLSAAVLYENLVIESYARSPAPEMPIVAIYPVEGTFWSDHPYAILDADWVGAEEREAAEAFLAFLKARPAQERALALGFRPADPSIPVGAPVDAAHGVDPKQPQTLLEVPDAATLARLLDLWKELKKTADVIFVFDKSGSMAGRPLAEAKEGAKAFLARLAPRDEVTLIFFDHEVHPPFGPMRVDKSRAALESRVDGAIADGGTALYDATAKAYDLALTRSRKNPGAIHAVVIMTDGRDESSAMTFDTMAGRFTDETAPVKVFTIAYGEGGDASILAKIAEAARGASAKGSVESIVQVYQDMASFF